VEDISKGPIKITDRQRLASCPGNMIIPTGTHFCFISLSYDSQEPAIDGCCRKKHISVIRVLIGAAPLGF